MPSSGPRRGLVVFPGLVLPVDALDPLRTEGSVLLVIARPTHDVDPFGVGCCNVLDEAESASFSVDGQFCSCFDVASVDFDFGFDDPVRLCVCEFLFSGLFASSHCPVLSVGAA